MSRKYYPPMQFTKKIKWIPNYPKLVMLSKLKYSVPVLIIVRMKKKSGEKSERDKLLSKLHEAATDGKLGLLRALLRRHPEEVNTPCGFSKSPALVTAASKGMLLATTDGKGLHRRTYFFIYDW